MSTETTYLRNPDVALRDEDDDGALLFNPDTNQVLVLNPTAVCVWKNCNGTLNVTAMINLIKEEFDEVPNATVEEEILKFLTDMTKGGYICLPEK
jgi:hypothetical protein